MHILVDDRNILAYNDVFFISIVLLHKIKFHLRHTLIMSWLYFDRINKRTQMINGYIINGIFTTAFLITNERIYSHIIQTKFSSEKLSSIGVKFITLRYHLGSSIWTLA